MHQQALNHARSIKNFYDCPSSEAYSSLTLSAAPWAGLRLRHGAGAGLKRLKLSNLCQRAPAAVAQIFMVPGLGDAHSL
jgi:hypothetical protein